MDEAIIKIYLDYFNACMQDTFASRLAKRARDDRVSQCWQARPWTFIFYIIFI